MALFTRGIFFLEINEQMMFLFKSGKLKSLKWMRKHMNDIQKAKVIALYQKNDKLKWIADRLNVSKSGIKRLIEYITMCMNNGFLLPSQSIQLKLKLIYLWN